MKKLTIVLVLMASVLCSCASSKRKHLGTWKVTTPDGDIVAHITAETIRLEMPDYTSTGRYSIDYAKTPVWLDFMNDDGETVRCIVEFPDKDSFRVIGEGDDNEPRPSVFAPAERVLLFKRVENQK